MGQKISQYTERLQLTGEEEAIVAFEGQNFKFKLKKIRSLVTKADVGLDKVDNTPDAEKPISQLQQAALNDKAELHHDHQIGDVTGLADALDSKAGTDATWPIANVEGLDEALDGKAALHHDHEIPDVAGLEDALGGKAPVQHTHSKNQVDGLNDQLNAMTDQINGKAASVHSHSPDQINGLEQYVKDIIANSPDIGDVAVDELQW